MTTTLPSNPGLASLQLFTGEAHEPFHWEGGRPAALFIHGFLGTPADMRPLADALNANGWTVEGVLLPGFGSEIDTLFARRWPEWTGAVHHKTCPVCRRPFTWRKKWARNWPDVRFCSERCRRRRNREQARS